jgi:hypothetical protein
MTFMSVMQGTTFALYLVRNFLVIALACFGGLVSLAQYKGGPLLLIFYEGSGCLYSCDAAPELRAESAGVADSGDRSRRPRHQLTGGGSLTANQ